MRYITSWYNIPLLSCMSELKRNILDIVSGNIKVYAVDTGTSVVVFGIWNYDTISKYVVPRLISYNGFDSVEQLDEAIRTLIDIEEHFDVSLKIADFSRGEIFVCDELHNVLKDEIFKAWAQDFKKVKS